MTTARSLSARDRSTWASAARRSTRNRAIRTPMATIRTTSGTTIVARMAGSTATGPTSSAIESSRTGITIEASAAMSAARRHADARAAMVSVPRPRRSSLSSRSWSSPSDRSSIRVPAPSISEAWPNPMGAGLHQPCSAYPSPSRLQG
ncbi:hypothetical protein [Sphingomonas sp. SORGH_AS_0438]|uniref:hypothetical protein n=1 Tax=Sphingomonas sp. SORGH_AS_0438 TaxID=3041756 RepID=UPI002864E7E0|nr:hypothetical protein [Sphingomonas sp. SORGH_AS_0438]MDR6125672.1 hypothetical protein [Sphingomonas sp. SORGH_AS_0438]